MLRIYLLLNVFYSFCFHHAIIQLVLHNIPLSWIVVLKISSYIILHAFIQPYAQSLHLVHSQIDGQ